MNHHAEHHLWPYVPYYNLPALAPRVGSSRHMEVRAGYLAFLWLFFRRLPFAEERAAASRGNA